MFLRYHEAVMPGSAIPLLLWCWPSGTGSLPVEAVAELARHPRIVGVKNDDDPFYYYYDLIRATAGCDFAVISGGQMRNFMLGYPIGSPAYLCGIAPFRPDIALQFHDCLRQRRFDDAWQIVFRYEEPWLRTAERLGWLQSIKSALHIHGLYPNYQVATPRDSHTAEQHSAVRACLEATFGPIRPWAGQVTA